MNDYATFIDPESLRIERILPGPIERVWAYLTESDKKAKWLAGGEVEARVGGKVTQNFHHAQLSDDKEELPEKYKHIGESSTMHGKVLRYEPYTFLSYSWDEGDEGESEVSFELSELEDGKVQLVLTHTRIPDSMDFKVGVSAGWHTHLNILRDVLQGQPVKGFWSVHMPLEEEYSKRL